MTMWPKVEYRVCWRRERDHKKRTRLYQTEAGARDFAAFIEVGGLDVTEGSVLGDNLIALGEVTEVWVETRPVGEWLGGEAL